MSLTTNITKAALCTAGLGLIAGGASAGIIFDQIGPNDGSELVAALIPASQDFEAAFDVYDIISIDDFMTSGETEILTFEAVLGGFNGYAGYEGVTAFSVRFYDEAADAGLDLADTIATRDLAAPSLVVASDISPTGPDDLLAFAMVPAVTVGGGTDWVGLFPENEFGSNGQTGIIDSNLGDFNSFQANPAGGFGFPPDGLQVAAANCAYRLLATGIDLCVTPACPGDLDGNGEVATNDLLILLAAWGMNDGNASCLAPPTDTVDTADLLVLLAAWGPCPEPDNDTCENATEILGTGTIQDTLVGATSDNVADCLGTPADGPGRWYTFTALSDSIYTISTCNPGTAIDTRINVYCNGCPGSSIECIAGDADGGCGCAPGTQGSLQLCAAEGIVYYVLVHAPDGVEGDYELEIDILGDCSDPTGDCVGPDGDFCQNPIPIDNGDTAFSTIGAGTDGVAHATCEFDGQTYQDIWFVYEADEDALLNISTCNQADYDTDLVVYDNNGPAPCPPTDAELLACNDDGAGCAGFTSFVNVQVSAGDSILIRVGGWNPGDEGTGTLSITKEAPPEPFECPAGATEEADQSSTVCPTDGFDGTTDDNGGCNSVPFAFGMIDCGQTICGDAGTYIDISGGQFRDTDWYAFTSPGGEVTVTASSVGSLLFGIVDSQNGSCTAPAFLEFGNLLGGGDTDSVSTVATVPGNQYEAFAAPDVFTGRPCDGSDSTRYWVELSCGAAGTGACCFGDGSCMDDLEAGECAGMGGSYQGDDSACASVECPMTDCGVDGGQPATDPDAGWTFGVADADFPDLTRYEQTSIGDGTDITTLRIEGITTIIPGFAPCTEASQTFDWTVWSGDPSGGGSPFCSGTATVTGTDTGVDYVGGAGTYNLFQWDIPADCTNAPASAWIGLQASGGATDCQWLWASSGEAGAGSSLLNNAGTFTVETFDLQYCINP